MRGFLLTIALCAALAVAGCGGSDDSTSGDTGENAATAAKSPVSQNLNAKPKIEAPGGAAPTELEENEVVEGSGAAAKAGDQVTVQYVGANFKSGQEFDASWDRGEPFTFNLGGGEVIQGWDQGIVGMKIGGRRELIIPPELGYGPEGSPPTIPPNETLIFVVDLVAVK
jgi:peptidylprolyl isomerase